MTQDLAYYRTHSIPIEQIQTETIQLKRALRLPIGIFHEGQRLTSFTVDNEAIGMHTLSPDRPQDPVDTISRLLGGDKTMPPLIVKIGDRDIAEIAHSKGLTVSELFTQMYVADICKMLFVLRYLARGLADISGDVSFTHLDLSRDRPPLFEIQIPFPLLINGTTVNFIYTKPLSLKKAVSMVNEIVRDDKPPGGIEGMIFKNTIVAIPELTPGMILPTDALISQIDEATGAAIVEAYQKIDLLGIDKQVEVHWLLRPRAFCFGK